MSEITCAWCGAANTVVRLTTRRLQNEHLLVEARLCAACERCVTAYQGRESMQTIWSFYWRPCHPSWWPARLGPLQQGILAGFWAVTPAITLELLWLLAYTSGLV